MNLPPFSRTPLVLLALLQLPPAPAPRVQTRQSAPDSVLFRTMATLDTELFDAYNTCNLERFASFFTEDVEFYHDKGGVTRGRPTLVESVKNNICGKTRRDLIPASLEVHPMDGYGALQIGAHRFCDAKAKQCDDKDGGVGKFIHLWQNKDGIWQITRVISYDHAPAAGGRTSHTFEPGGAEKSQCCIHPWMRAVMAGDEFQPG